MWFNLALTAVLFYLFIKWWKSRNLKSDLDQIPGPPRSNVIWDFITGRASDPFKAHLTMSALAQKYGPIFKILRGDQNIVVVSDYEGLFQLYVKGGKEVRGRNSGFRFDAILEKTGIIGNDEPGATWKALRKHTQHHLKQFGEGMNRLELIISTMAEDMFEVIESNIGVPFNPTELISDTALNTIAFLTTGERMRSGDHVVKLMREYERLFFKAVPVVVPLGIKVLDMFPWLRYFGLPSWKIFQRLHKLEHDIWKTIGDMNDANPDAESVCKVLRDQITHGTNKGNIVLSENDARKTTMGLLTAGMGTTSRAFYSLINILAHHQDIQEKLADELQAITKGTRDVNLNDKVKMHYARAILHEVHRYVSVAPHGARLSASVNAKLKGYAIPVDTLILPNLWELHHDPSFWPDPFVFRPERFLDEQGEVVPADHPNRKHLLPFGAGMRVCVGEKLANTRILLWMAAMIQRYEVTPAESNYKESSDPRGFNFGSILTPTPYEVIFNRRSSA